jgi:hypothetical protein
MTTRQFFEVRGIEHATRGDKAESEARLVPTIVNGRTEMLPANPREVARILKERRAKSPAARVRAKMAADLKRRGIG